MINKSETTLYGITHNESEVRIKNANALVFEMQKEVDKYTRLLQLAEQDRINVVKNNVHYFLSESTFMFSAQKWLSMTNECDIDKRKKYEEKEDFELVTNYIKNMLDDSEIAITEIIPMGFNNYAWSVVFISKGVTFEITFPVIMQLDEKIWNHVCEGKIVLYHEESKSYWKGIISSYKEEDICKAYKDFLEKNK